jgi:hypothetical protein
VEFGWGAKAYLLLSFLLTERVILFVKLFNGNIYFSYRVLSLEKGCIQGQHLPANAP